MDYVLGDILSKDGFSGGYIGFECNKIVEIGAGNPPKKPQCKGLIVPLVINAHTHIGDSFIATKNIDLPKDVEQLVAPPHGLKHQLLREASDDDIIMGMARSLNLMKNSGTMLFCDFREEGIAGIHQLQRALRVGGISCCIFARPATLTYDAAEMNLLVAPAQGIGVSSLSDWDYDELAKVARHTKKRNKLFALHASERVREDIDRILGLEPDILIHMIHATKSDFIKVREAGIPIVVCPRSNAFYGLQPPLGLMKRVGVSLMLGTDNAMIASPNVVDEVKYVMRKETLFSLEELLMMITYTPRKVLNWDDHILGPGSPANFVVLDRESLQPLYVSMVYKEG
ncbi:MAG: amidohydrolase family protein [Candidatus Thermoplasmatota archaeon]|nr:amidohydrolase family protein [Candidatus Thermoplasmatota archaeon]